MRGRQKKLLIKKDSYEQETRVEGQGRQVTHAKSYLTLPPHYTTQCANYLAGSIPCHHLP
jgi:hypothetical protein